MCWTYTCLIPIGDISGSDSEERNKLFKYKFSDSDDTKGFGVCENSCDCGCVRDGNKFMCEEGVIVGLWFKCSFKCESPEYDMNDNGLYNSEEGLILDNISGSGSCWTGGFNKSLVNFGDLFVI